MSSVLSLTVAASSDVDLRIKPKLRTRPFMFEGYSEVETKGACLWNSLFLFFNEFFTKYRGTPAIPGVGFRPPNIWRIPGGGFRVLTLHKLKFSDCIYNESEFGHRITCSETVSANN